MPEKRPEPQVSSHGKPKSRNRPPKIRPADARAARTRHHQYLPLADGDRVASHGLARDPLDCQWHGGRALESVGGSGYLYAGAFVHVDEGERV